MSKDNIQNNPLSDGLLQDRAFTIRCGGEASPAQSLSAGRVEHISTGQVTHFESLPELLAIVNQILASVKNRPSDDP